MLILIGKYYRNDNVKCCLASIALAKSSVLQNNTPESCSKGASVLLCTHADSSFTSLICFAFGFKSLSQDPAGCCEPPFLVRLPRATRSPRD